MLLPQAATVKALARFEWKMPRRGAVRGGGGILCPVARFLRSSASSRRLAVVVAIFGVVVLFDLFLFGWLIFRSLSEREIQNVLLQTTKQAEDIARSIESRALTRGGDLYTVMASEQRIREVIDAVVQDTGYIREIKIFDSDGTLVVKTRTVPLEAPADGPALDEPAWNLEPGEMPSPPMALEPEEVRSVVVPIGELGSVFVSLSAEGLDQRIADLRSNLIGQAATIGLVTTALLVGGSVLIWLLLRRSRRLEAEKVESERMAYIGTLASGLAHEIRNPLNSLNLNVQMLEEDLREKGELDQNRKLIGITRSELRRLDRLVTDFLSYARPRPLDRIEVRAVDLLVSAGEQLVSEANSQRAALEVEDRSGGATVQVDAGQMRQLLLNLIQNAFAAVEGADRPARVVLAAERRGPTVDLLVTDNGVGIAPADRDRIFEIFYSTKKGGTGLGLAIVQRIAQTHGGTVSIESHPGAGTTVRVSLPASSREATGSFPIPVAAASRGTA